MTVSTIVPVNNYPGNNSYTKFDFNFLIQNQDELQVTLTDKNGIVSILQYGIDYSINEIGNENGSYITFPLASSSFGILKPDETITLSLSLVIKQESQFKNSANLNLSILEQTFDYIVRVLQILDRKIERCVKTKEGIEINPDNLMAQINSNALVSLDAAKTSIDAANSADVSKSLILDKLDYVENFSQNTINELLEKGIETRAKIDFSNLSESAENHFVNKSQITNCIIETPEKVKFTLNREKQLDVKAGTIAIIPYGVDDLTSQYPIGTVVWNILKVIDTYYQDGKFFIKVELQQDTNFDNPDAIDSRHLLGFRQTGRQIWTIIPSTIFSSDTQPTIANYGIWYDTANNYVKYTTDGGLTWEIVSFPILEAYHLNGVWFKINTLFDNIGYIGSVIWVDKGIKVLIPNGKNKDGFLNNIEFETEKLYLFSVPKQTNRCVVLGIDKNGVDTLSTYDTNNYDIVTNYNYSANCDIQSVARIGDIVVDENFKITSFKPKTAFQVLDANKPHITDVYNLHANNGYMIYSNGLGIQWGSGTAPSTANTWGSQVALNKRYSNASYKILLTNHGNTATAGALKYRGETKTADFFEVASTVQGTAFNWMTFGQLAEGEY